MPMQHRGMHRKRRNCQRIRVENAGASGMVILTERTAGCMECNDCYLLTFAFDNCTHVLS
jgi:hypothetical protein